MTERVLTPINEVRTDIVRFDIPFPNFVDQGRIGVDVPKVDRAVFFTAKVLTSKLIDIIPESDGKMNDNGQRVPKSH